MAEPIRRAGARAVLFSDVLFSKPAGVIEKSGRQDRTSTLTPVSALTKLRHAPKKSAPQQAPGGGVNGRAVVARLKGLEGLLWYALLKPQGKLRPAVGSV